MIRLSLLLVGCERDPDADTGTPVPEPVVVPPNVLLVILDDIGVDKIAAYGASAGQPPTPTFDRLAADGVLFRNAYATPNCSPTRAALFTGRFGRRTGMGDYISPTIDRFSLPPAEITLPTVLAAAPVPYASALVGKWHLVSYNWPVPAEHPRRLGFTDFEGSLSNLSNTVEPGAIYDYFHWEKVVDGALTTSDVYAPTDVVNDAIDRLHELPEPFFLTVAFHLAHTPRHVPPPDLLDSPLPDDATDDEMQLAMIAAGDRELGRLLDALPPELRARTTVCVLSDNGSATTILPPQDPARSKGSLYDGGVRVPFVITGPQVTTPGSISDALVSVVDILPTLAEIAGVDLAAADPHPLDGTSFLAQLTDPTMPGPTYLYSEQFNPNGAPPYTLDGRMVRDATHKLIRDAALGTESLFRYVPGAVDEGPDLAAAPLTPEDQTALDRLRAELDRRTAALVYDGP